MASKQESRFVLNYNEYRQFSCDMEIGILLFSLQPEMMILYSKLCSQKTYSGKTFSHNPRLQPMNNSVETDLSGECCYDVNIKDWHCSKEENYQTN